MGASRLVYFQRLVKRLVHLRSTRPRARARASGLACFSGARLSTAMVGVSLCAVQKAVGSAALGVWVMPVEGQHTATMHFVFFLWRIFCDRQRDPNAPATTLCDLSPSSCNASASAIALTEAADWKASGPRVGTNQQEGRHPHLLANWSKITSHALSMTHGR